MQTEEACIWLGGEVLVGQMEKLFGRSVAVHEEEDRRWSWGRAWPPTRGGTGP